MPPSCPHAVFTPEDCLAVGGQVYTAAHLGSSLDGLQMQEAYPGISNEDVQPETYDLLYRIFTTLDELCKEYPRVREALHPAALAISTSAYLEALDVTMANSQLLQPPQPTPLTVATSTQQPAMPKKPKKPKKSAKCAKPTRSTTDTTDMHPGISEWEFSRTTQRVQQRESAQSLITLASRKRLVEILTDREKRHLVAIGLLVAPQE